MPEDNRPNDRKPQPESQSDLRRARRIARKKRAAQKESKTRRVRRRAQRQGGGPRFAVLIGLLAVAALVVVLLLWPLLGQNHPANTSSSLWLPSFSLPPAAGTSSSSIATQPPPAASQGPQGPLYQLQAEDIATLDALATGTEAFGGQASIWFIDLEADVTYGYRETEAFQAEAFGTAAYSLYLYHLAEENTISPDELFSVQSAHVQDLKDYTGDLKLTEPPTQRTLRELVRMMLRESDPVAQRMLLSRYPMDAFTGWLSSLGITPTDGADRPQALSWTAVDMGRLLAQLYQQLETGRHSAALQEDVIASFPAGQLQTTFPTQTISAQSDNLWGQAAIVRAYQPYLLVVLTSNVPTPQQSALGTQLPTVLEELMSQNRSMG